MRFLGHGAPSIRATHTKTLELSTDHTISERATCIVAVDTHAEPAIPLAGPVRIRLSVRDQSFTLHANANPTWAPGGPAVIRRSPLRLPGTFATNADASAADLPRDLVAALASPEEVVEVSVEPIHPAHETVVLGLADAGSNAAWLRAEQQVADRIVVEDAEARALVPRHESTGPTPRRTLVVATRDLPGQAVLDQLRDPDVAVETIGLPARLAAAAAAPSRAPLVLAPDGTDHRDLLRATPAGYRLVLSLNPDRVPEVLALADQVRGGSDAVLAQEHAPPQRASAAHVPELAVRDTVHCCLFASGDESNALDPPVRAAIARLVEDGVGTRTIARVLSELTGRPRSAAYTLALELTRDASG